MALAVTVLLPLPAVVGEIRVRPLPLLGFLGHFLVDLAASGAQVAWQALRPGRQGQSAIVRVRLRTDSDLLLTIITEAVSLVPGSMVIDLDREARELGLHVLSVDSDEDLERQRRSVLVTEDRVVRAFGTDEDRAALARESAGSRP